MIASRLATTGHVAYISAADISLPNGPGVNEREFAITFLRALGARARVFVPKPTLPLPELPLDRVTFYGGGRSARSLRPLIDPLDLMRSVRPELVDHPPDLIVVRVGVLPLALERLLKTLAIPFAVKTVGDCRFLRRYGGFRGQIARLVAPLHERSVGRILNAAIAVDCCTPLLLDSLRRDFRIPETSLRLIPNATNTTRFSPGSRMDSRAELNLQKFDPILGYVGGEPVQRGGREIVETVARLASDYPRIGALIVGSRSPDLLRLAEHRNVAERCRFPGVVPYEEVPRYLHAFDIGFALDRAERVKIVGNSYQKLRQYVACGIPSVASPGGSEFLSEHDLGSIVDVSDLDAIERETRRWLSLTHHDRASFPERASTYAREHLSTERALRDRLEFWDSRLSVHVSTRRTA